MHTQPTHTHSQHTHTHTHTVTQSTYTPTHPLPLTFKTQTWAAEGPSQTQIFVLFRSLNHQFVLGQNGRRKTEMHDCVTDSCVCVTAGSVWLPVGPGEGGEGRGGDRAEEGLDLDLDHRGPQTYLDSMDHWKPRFLVRSPCPQPAGVPEQENPVSTCAHIQLLRPLNGKCRVLE